MNRVIRGEEKLSLSKLKKSELAKYIELNPEATDEDIDMLFDRDGVKKIISPRAYGV